MQSDRNSSTGDEVSAGTKMPKWFLISLLVIITLILILDDFSLRSLITVGLLLFYTIATRYLVDEFKKSSLTRINDDGIDFVELGLGIKKRFIQWSRIDIVELKILGDEERMKKPGELVTTLKNGRVFKVTTHKPYDLAQSIYALLHNNPQPNHLPVFNIY